MPSAEQPQGCRGWSPSPRIRTGPIQETELPWAGGYQAPERAIGPGHQTGPLPAATPKAETRETALGTLRPRPASG